MSDAGAILSLLITAGVGAALFCAGREFARGLRLSKQEHNARVAGGPDAAHHNNTNYQDDARDNEAQRPWHEVLEVPALATEKEIKVAYRRMMALYHPDRVNDLGVDLRVVAERRAKEINGAYVTARNLLQF